MESTRKKKVTLRKRLSRRGLHNLKFELWENRKGFRRIGNLYNITNVADYMKKHGFKDAKKFGYHWILTNKYNRLWKN